MPPKTPAPIAWKTEQRKVSELVEHATNPRQMTEKQVADLTASLEKFGLAEIPAINTDNMILAGHQRLRILAVLGRGEEVIDVRVPTRKLTKAEADEYLIRSNKNVGDWDFDILANSFDTQELIDWGFEAWNFGIDPDKLEMDGDDEGGGKKGDEEKEKAKKGDDSYSAFEIVLLHEDKKLLIELLGETRKRLAFDANSDALMHIVRFYDRTKTEGQ